MVMSVEMGQRGGGQTTRAGVKGCHLILGQAMLSRVMSGEEEEAMYMYARSTTPTLYARWAWRRELSDAACSTLDRQYLGWSTLQ